MDIVQFHVIDIVIQESVLKQKKEHVSTDWDEKDTCTLLNRIESILNASQ